ncbi:MAG TPA: type II secretion system protein [Chthoniobacterales bacterium]|jgi:prepilin-type N-terminal cleavage/methylation domain-containing protein|nr:type II secretion system protein [Chthoniobacterales bacterium]
MDTNKHEFRKAGFTLIELLVVIAIIAVLLGFIFPVFQGVQDRASKVQAKNDLTQIVTAVNAFYTEYGRYPTTSNADVTFVSSPTNDQLLDVLRNNTSGSNASTVTSLNPRGIVFVSPAEDTSQTSPRGKIGSNGQFYDPWAQAYSIRIDADYDNQVNNPYSQDTGAGGTQIRQGVIGWSGGKDGKGPLTGGSTMFKDSDDVISWQ